MPVATSSTRPIASKPVFDNALGCNSHKISQDESSEEFIGEWMEKRGNREQLFIATKVRFSITFYVHKPHSMMHSTVLTTNEALACLAKAVS